MLRLPVRRARSAKLPEVPGAVGSTSAGAGVRRSHDGSWAHTVAFASAGSTACEFGGRGGNFVGIAVNRAYAGAHRGRRILTKRCVGPALTDALTDALAPVDGLDVARAFGAALTIALAAPARPTSTPSRLRPLWTTARSAGTIVAEEVRP